ncbi:3-phosphoshikimate 1-carboxyvinyltransferase [bacterium]|nr:3-phosphoshikimate 1-carboxyvinyltransferase [bacterium]
MERSDCIQIPCSTPVNGTIRIPGSKSITNRAILIASLAKGTSYLDGMLYSDDTHFMMSAWEKLGSAFRQEGNILEVTGCDGRLEACSTPIYVENAGTAARFLTAALTLGKGTYVLDGNERMRQRPILDLIGALNTLGARVEDSLGTGCPPVTVIADGLTGGAVRIAGEKSSQYISALLLAAPYASRQTTIQITGSLVSRSYVELTIDMMRSFGVQCEWLNEHCLTIDPGQRYSAQNYWIEGDASSASYFFGLAAITQGSIKVTGLRKNSSQGDLGLLAILQQMGCDVCWEEDGVLVTGRPLKAVEVDMNTMSDVAPTLAVISLFAEGTTKILNVGNMRIKECDRIHALTVELRKLGAVVTETETGISITGGMSYQGADLATWNDHRMAMSLSLAGLKIPGVGICDPNCVSKTFPAFFEMFLPLLTS